MIRRDTSETVGGTDSPREASGDARAQTTLDFVVGVVFFLAVLLFVFSFVPGMLEPFTEGTQEETVGVNRIADELSQRQLGDPAEPYVLNATCTARFFDGSSPGTCRFDSGSIEQRLDLELRQQVNITVTASSATDIRDPDNVRCYNRTTNTLVAQSGNCGANAVVLRAGSPVERGSSSSVSARRTVLLDGEDVSITVVLW